MANQSVGKAEARYSQLKGDRASYLERARECSELTLPMLIPEEGGHRVTRFKTPFQGVGARGVNNLASKLLLALLPPNAPFFRLVVDRIALRKENQKELKTEIEAALADVEKAVMEDIETSGDRTIIFETLKHLIVGGNALLYVGEDGTRMFPLARYVVKRDPMGNVLEIITHETVAPDALDPGFLKRIKGKPGNEGKDSVDRTLNLYTHVKRRNNEWVAYQECAGEVIPDTRVTYPLYALPFIALRFNHIDGEDYGRGYVEEYLGDLKSLEGLTKAIVEGSAAAAKVLILVNPNGTTRAKTIAEAPSGAVREGVATDVTTVQLDKFADFRVAYSAIERIEQRLEYAFLLNTSIQRNGERVTAEEIRYMAGELEDALGGVYSILSQEFQLPYVNVRLNRLERDGKISLRSNPNLPEDFVRPSIVTGVEALGRGHDRSKLVAFIGTIGQALGPQGIAQYIHPDEVIARLAVADGIDPEGLVKTKEEIAQEQQQALMQQMVDRLGPDAMRMAAQSQQQPQGTQ